MLKIRTAYSFRQAAGKLPDVVARLKENQETFAPITDRASTFGWARWDKLAREAGLKPVFGVELAVSPEPTAKKPVSDHWTFIAGDDIGPINKLVDIATTQFRYQPLLTVEQAFEAAQSCAVVMGYKPQIDWENVPPNVHVELSPATSRYIAKTATKHGVPFAATSDNRYPTIDDRVIYETIAGRKGDLQIFPQHIMNMGEWQETVLNVGLSIGQINEAVHASECILESSTATLRTGNLPEPNRPAPLMEMCEDGARERGIDLGSNQIYADRLAYELKLIHDKKFEDYFYIVADVVQWARKRMIVGPARGSSCGSLVCYLLGITTVDPIPFGLIFERFIDINRMDYPDIDIDFSDQQRSLVFDYLRDTYGYDYVARLGTVAMYQGKSAIKELSGALRIPKWKCEQFGDSLIEAAAGDDRAHNTIEDTFAQTTSGKLFLKEYPGAVVATRYEGHPRHYSQHAAGVVISSVPITDIVAVDNRTRATMCDKVDAEDVYNLLKIDVLGLKQLSVFEDALELAGLPFDALENLPLDDPAAFQVLNDGKFSGVFQFQGKAAQSLVRRFTVEKFDDLVTATALARPGPLNSGGAEEWTDRRSGDASVRYPHELFEPYLQETAGVIVYQEQVMQIARHVGGLSWEDVTALRKVMGRTKGVEALNAFGDGWKAGAMERGVTQEDADRLWGLLCEFGAYGFNKSHSVAYGLISYWCCWLKAHHPHAYIAACLSHETDVDRQIPLLREVANEGYGYVPIDPERSIDKWTIGEKDGEQVLIGPLQNVKGIGPVLVREIMASRSREKPMSDRAKKLLHEAKTDIDTLFPVRDGIHRVMPDPTARNIRTPPVNICDVDVRANIYEVMLFCTVKDIRKVDENEPDRLKRRGGKRIEGPNTQALMVRFVDDSGEILAKVHRDKFSTVAKEIVDRGGEGKELYAVKGAILGHRGNPKNAFKLMMVNMVRHLGNINDEPAQQEAAE